MNVIDNVRPLLRGIKILGLLSIREQCRPTVQGEPFQVGHHFAVIKFLLFGATFPFVCYAIVFGLIDMNIMDTPNDSMWLMVSFVHSVTLCFVIGMLFWQTFWQRHRLAKLMNIVHQNEVALQRATRGASDYRKVKLLATVILWSGLIFHAISHLYYLGQIYMMKTFFKRYAVCCLFLYEDLAMEYLLGLCSCLLLIVQIQMDRLARLAKELDDLNEEHPGHLLPFYVSVYERIVSTVENCFSPYFGPLILVFCPYVCFEGAISMLRAYGIFSFEAQSMENKIMNNLWPLVDIKKLWIVFSLSARFNATQLDGYENPERLMELYVRLYHRIVSALGDYFSPYFGPVIFPYCTYVCFESAAAIMQLTETLVPFYHRKRFTILLNTLFSHDELILEWLTEARANKNALKPTHCGNLWFLTALVIAYCFYDLVFVTSMEMLLLEILMTVRFVGMFVMIELYRACVQTINVRMKQLTLLLIPAGEGSNDQPTERVLQIFLEKYQLYYEQIENVNRCFSVPLVYILLIILLDRVEAAYDLYVNLTDFARIPSWDFFGMVVRQTWELVYVILAMQIAITAESTALQRYFGDMCRFNKQRQFVLRILSAIYYLPCSYNPRVNRFVENRSNVLSFCFGLLVSFGYIYHDCFVQQRFMGELSPFSLTITILELGLLLTIPLFTVLNNLVHRRRFTTLLNVLFAEDPLLDQCGVPAAVEQFRAANDVYRKVFGVLMLLLTIVKLNVYENFEGKMFVLTITARFLCVTMFLYLFHLCVTMVRLRMAQLRTFLNQHQRELDFGNHLEQFMRRFQHYAAQIEQINRCFSHPMLLMYLQAMLEMAFCTFECFSILNNRGKLDYENYYNLIDWVSTQVWQALYGYILLLTAPCCASVWEESLYKLKNNPSHLK
ncbi:AGAP009805-PL-like protein [Anopheles sinensis]|uniref:AGAP009805-PL-like protein n=1 Tax=Anopheles sinensis TaxID=74873 RepID=A0A084WG54_ANOSI|nr:AGAP009805-PL-like protein [Anopheles sinensis]